MKRERVLLHRTEVEFKSAQDLRDVLTLWQYVIGPRLAHMVAAVWLLVHGLAALAGPTD